MNGFRRCSWPDGSKYEGNLRKGLRSGIGTQYYFGPTSVYEGEWHGDVREG